MSREPTFVARQPILDARQRVYAYELLFRPSLTSVASDGGSEAASASVISNAFLNIGLDAMTHGAGWHLNVTVPEWSWMAGGAVPPAVAATGWSTLAVLALALVLTFVRTNSTMLATGMRLELPRLRYAFGALLALSLVYVQNAGEFIYFIF